MDRINVVGMSCAGKTTLARRLAACLGLPAVELDALFWGPAWTPVDESTFRARVAAALDGDTWVADGGYQIARDITWRRVDTVVWLDYSLLTILGRWARRTMQRIRSREEFWPGTGNRESVRNALRRDGLLWWILTNHGGKRRRMVTRLAARPDIAVVRLRTPSQAERWLAGLQRSTSASTTAGASASAQKP